MGWGNDFKLQRELKTCLINELIMGFVEQRDAEWQDRSLVQLPSHYQTHKTRYRQYRSSASRSLGRKARSLQANLCIRTTRRQTLLNSPSALPSNRSSIFSISPPVASAPHSTTTPYAYICPPLPYPEIDYSAPWCLSCRGRQDDSRLDCGEVETCLEGWCGLRGLRECLRLRGG